MRGFNPRWIVGKTIDRVEMNHFPSGRGLTGRAITYDPSIYFTDGSAICFLTDETEGNEYGVRIIYTKASPQ